MALRARRIQVMRSTLSRPVLILIIGACAVLIGGLLAACLLPSTIRVIRCCSPALPS
jgi:hypothetical protein